MQGNKPESRFVQRVNSHEGCWYHSRQDHDPQFNAEQSNQTARRHSPHLSVPRNNIPRCPAINLNLVLSKESTATKDVGTTVDKTTIPSLTLSNQIKRQDVTLPTCLFPANDIPRCPAINLNLVLSKESTARRDVSTTVDKTTIPRQCNAVKSNEMPCFPIYII